MTETGLLQANGPGAKPCLAHPAALRFLSDLLTNFEARRGELLAARSRFPGDTYQDESPLLSSRSPAVDWQTAETPAELRDRRVSLHTDTDTASLQGAIGSGAANVTVDIEEALPIPGNALALQSRLLDIFDNDEGSATDQRMPLIFGPRALERTEPALLWNGAAAPAALVDAGLFLFLHAARLAERGTTVCLRLSRLQSPAEAAFWRDLIGYAEEHANSQPGAIKIDLGIETVPAVFACDAILGELKERAVALTFDRHACLQSFVRTFPDLPQFVLPDRSELSTAAHFLHSWAMVVIGTAHRRNVSAIGPCATYLPPPEDSESRVLEKLRIDKERHAHDGFDGSAVAHPGLCEITRDVFDRLMPGQHQHHRKREDLRITGADLLQVRKGKITENGLRRNLRICLHGLLAVASGATSLTLDQRRETAASIEFAADQLWQWRRHATGVLDDGRMIDDDLLRSLLDHEQKVTDAPAAALDEARQQLVDHLAAEHLPGELLHK